MEVVIIRESHRNRRVGDRQQIQPMERQYEHAAAIQRTIIQSASDLCGRRHIELAGIPVYGPSKGEVERIVQGR